MPTAQQQPIAQLTEQSSLSATQNLLAALVSELCFARNIFGVDSFDKPKKIAGTFFRPLKREASSKDQEGVIVLLRWLEEGVFPALRKGYLSMFMIGIYTDPEQPEKLLEGWYFKCQSNGSWAVSRETSSSQSKLIASTTAEVTKSVNSFVRSVVAMGLHIKPLPRERCIGMRLYYNPENPPPEDFQPSEDFCECQDRLSWAAKPSCMPMGTDYMTPYHSVELRLKTLVDQMDTLLEEETFLEPEDALNDDEMWHADDDDEDFTTATEIEDHEDSWRRQLVPPGGNSCRPPTPGCDRRSGTTTPTPLPKETSDLIAFITHLSNYSDGETISTPTLKSLLKMDSPGCARVVTKLVSLGMLTLKNSRGQGSYTVSPLNAMAAQTALRNEALALPRVSASPSSTIVADTPVFARPSGSRNRIMAKPASAAVSPSSCNHHDPTFHDQLVANVAPAESKDVQNSDSIFEDEIEGLSAMMVDTAISEKERKPTVRRGRYGKTIMPIRSPLGVLNTASFKTNVIERRQPSSRSAATSSARARHLSKTFSRRE